MKNNLYFKVLIKAIYKALISLKIINIYYLHLKINKLDVGIYKHLNLNRLMEIIQKSYLHLFPIIMI